MKKNGWFKSTLIIIFASFFQVLTAQETTKNLKINVHEAEDGMLSPVKITDLNNNKIALKNGTYHIENSTQKGEIQIKDGVINGNFTMKETLVDSEETKKSTSLKEYLIKDSWVINYKYHIDDYLFAEGKREGTRVNMQSFYPNGKTKAEGWISLDKKKHYGVGVTKTYFEDGTLNDIIDDVTRTYTSHYSNGKLREINSPTVHESYNKDGTPYNKQYTKNNVRYDEYYYDGKLSTRSYKNAQQQDVKEEYEKGELRRKEVVKIINGTQRTYIYDKSGKLIDEVDGLTGMKTTIGNIN